ncbi:MAG: ABC transporter ATP-binding protein [Clostridia bacterium]|nr:ABC transporter ATP-binding protein [Clostridia bacterium]
MKKNKPYSTLKVALRFGKYSFKAIPKRMIILVIVELALCASLAITTIVNAQLYTAIETYNGQEWTTIAFWLAMGILIAVATPFLNSYVNSRIGDCVNRCATKMSIKVIEKINRLSPIEMEKPETLDAINKAEQGLGGGVSLVNILLLIVFGYLPFFIIIAIYLFTLRPILAIMPIIVFIPVLLSQLYKMKQSRLTEDKAAPIRRRYEHYENCMGAREFFKETRLLGAFHFFRRRYREAIRLLNREIWKKEGKVAAVELALQVMTFVFYGLLLMMLVDSLLKGFIGVGIFAAVFTSLSGMFSRMEEMLISNLGAVLETTPMAANVLKLLDMKEREGNESVDLDKGVRLENVHFSYPGSETESIKGVSLTIRPKETLAIVGMNGAGKSTLVKLIMGLYTPSAGAVYIGGANSQNADPDKLFEGTSTVFQDYGRYKMTLERNVRIGDFSRSDKDGEGLSTALTQGNVELDCGSYPDGVSTLLSQEFGGTDISGGQWQRIAIARGLYRTHELIILDEPTAAIDPMEETRVYNRFAEIAKDNTAIIVTHRLGSCKIADRIVVMDNGTIAEIGTHEELLKKQGLYAKMWDSQAEWLA